MRGEFTLQDAEACWGGPRAGNDSTIHTGKPVVHISEHVVKFDPQWIQLAIRLSNSSFFNSPFSHTITYTLTLMCQPVLNACMPVACTLAGCLAAESLARILYHTSSTGMSAYICIYRSLLKSSSLSYGYVFMHYV